MTSGFGETPTVNPNIKRLAPPEVNQIIGKYRAIQQFTHQSNITPANVQVEEDEVTTLSTKWNYSDFKDEKGNTYGYTVVSNKMSGDFPQNLGLNEIFLKYIDAEGKYSQSLRISRKDGDIWEAEGNTLPLVKEGSAVAIDTPIPPERVIPRANYLMGKYQELLRSSLR